MANVDLTAENFNDVIYENEVVIIDFMRPECPASQELDPILKSLSEKHQDVTFAWCNVEELPDVVASFELFETPTLAIFRRQNLVFKQAGVPFEDELEALIRQVQALDMETLLAES